MECVCERLPWKGSITPNKTFTYYLNILIKQPKSNSDNWAQFVAITALRFTIGSLYSSL